MKIISYEQLGSVDTEDGFTHTQARITWDDFTTNVVTLVTMSSDNTVLSTLDTQLDTNSDTTEHRKDAVNKYFK